jgi:hypothetical protein
VGDRGVGWEREEKKPFKVMKFCHNLKEKVLWGQAWANIIKKSRLNWISLSFLLFILN